MKNGKKGEEDKEEEEEEEEEEKEDVEMHQSDRPDSTLEARRKSSLPVHTAHLPLHKGRSA